LASDSRLNSISNFKWTILYKIEIKENQMSWHLIFFLVKPEYAIAIVLSGEIASDKGQKTLLHIPG